MDKDSDNQNDQEIEEQEPSDESHVKYREISADELKKIRRDFPKGRYSIHIEETRFKLKDYLSFLKDEHDDIEQFTQTRQNAFDEELQRWIDSGQINFESEQDLVSGQGDEEALPSNCMAIESPVAGNVWKMLVKQGDFIEADQTIAILESMKMEIEIVAPHDGIIYAISRNEGSHINAGQPLLILEEK